MKVATFIILLAIAALSSAVPTNNAKVVKGDWQKNVVLKTVRSDPHLTSFDPYEKIQAESYNYQEGITLETCKDTDGGLDVTGIYPGDIIGYFDANFGNGNASRVEFRLAASFTVGYIVDIVVRLDSQTGTQIAQQTVTSTGGEQTYVTLSQYLSTSVTGTHDVYLTFESDTGVSGYWSINWFQFISA